MEQDRQGLQALRDRAAQEASVRQDLLALQDQRVRLGRRELLASLDPPESPVPPEVRALRVLLERPDLPVQRAARAQRELREQLERQVPRG